MDDDAHGKLLSNAVTPGTGGSCHQCGVKLTTAPQPGGGALPETGSGSVTFAAAAAAVGLATGGVLLLRRRSTLTDNH